MIKHTDVLIIGGGVSGLASAWWLAQKGIRSTILEQSDRTGGLIDTTQQDGYVTDHAASMVLNFNTQVTQFISRSGLQDYRVNRNKISRRYVLKNNQLKQVPENIRGILYSDLFSLKTRLKLMSEPFRSHSMTDHETVAEFIRRRLGQEILDLAIDPYVSAVLACDPEKACARSTLPRLTSLERNFGSFTAGIIAKKLLPGKKGLPQEAFSFSGGMKTLTQTLSQNPLTDIHNGQKVLAVEPTKSGWRVTSKADNQEYQYLTKQLIFSTPANIAAALLQPVKSKLAELLNKIEYAPIAQIHMGFDKSGLNKSLDGNGFLIPSRENMDLRGSLWMSNLVKHRAPENKLLTSNFVGGGCQMDALKKSDAVLIDQTLSSLQKLTGIRQSPEMVRINRHQQGLPLYHGKYSDLTKAIQHRAHQSNGLHFVANYLHGISIRDRIIQAKSVSDQVYSTLRQHSHQSTTTVSINVQRVTP
ncbi:MAG: protoporphyrinogen oxidase [Gammaproteobacteria bacterium]|nr:protoporphyrinogen oxidase [Gammaproteobacteria bacterium]